MALRYKAELGLAIRTRREELGLTQRQLADRMKIQEPQTISRWERGLNAHHDLEAVAEALETTVGALLATISPPSRRKLMAVEEESQLDRIERKLDDLLSRLPEVDPLDEIARELGEDDPPSDEREEGTG